MHSTHQLDQYRCGHDGLVDHPVHHVFDRPGQLTYGGCANHSSRTFQRMKSATKLNQGLLIILVGRPAREILIQRLKHFTRFFNKDLNNFIVNKIVFTSFRTFRRWRRRAYRSGSNLFDYRLNFFRNDQVNRAIVYSFKRNFLGIISRIYCWRRMLCSDRLFFNRRDNNWLTNR